jgi:APA family basic amino acid/polyamine antiporter
LSTPQLERRLSLTDAISLVIGAVIGSAIFLVPAPPHPPPPSALAAMLTMAFAGVLSWFGALAYAELGAMHPDTGGEYVYLRQSWGPLAAFLLGWAFFWVIQSGGIAALAVGFSSLLGSVLPLSPLAAKSLPVALILLLTTINILGVRGGATVSNLFNILKLSGLAWMIVAVLAQPASTHIDWSFPTNWTPIQFSAALVPALWAFEGWNLLPCVAGELRHPQRDLPKALALGLGLIIAIYCLSLWIYLRVLPVSEIVHTESAATAAVARALSPTAALWVTITMLMALVSSTNSCILAAARVYYAQAQDRLFFQPFARVHPTHKTPAFSLAVQGLWSAILAASGTYETLFSYCTFGAWIFYSLTVAGVILLRRQRPGAARPYRVLGYPWAPILFVTIASAFVISCFITNPGSSSIGLALIASGVPFYLYWRPKTVRQ